MQLNSALQKEINPWPMARDIGINSKGAELSDLKTSVDMS